MSAPLQIVIIEDEAPARRLLVRLLAELAPGAVIVAELETVADARALFAAPSLHVDLVLSDIRLADGSALTLFEEGVIEAPVIFVTAYDAWIEQAFRHLSVDYLLKPFDDERFQAAWRRATTLIATGAVVAEARRLSGLVAAAEGRGAADPNLRRTGWIDRVVIRKDQRTFVVYLADVQWIESSGNYVVLHAGKEAHTLRESLVGLLSRLDPSRFVRIHRRIVVDVGALRELQPWFGGDQIMILKDGTKLRVSRSYRESLARSLAGGA